MTGRVAWCCWSHSVAADLISSIPELWHQSPGMRQMQWRHDQGWLGVGAVWSHRSHGPGRCLLAAAATADLHSRCMSEPCVSGQPIEAAAVQWQMTFTESEQSGRGLGWPEALAPLQLVLPRYRWTWQHTAHDGQVSDLQLHQAIRISPEQAAQLVQTEAENSEYFQDVLTNILKHNEPAPRPAFADDLQPLPARSDQDFITLVNDARELCETAALRKVVVARAVDQQAPADQPFSTTAVISRLAEQRDQRGIIYAVDLDNGACFIGNTPEWLLQLNGNELYSEALAGSRPRGTDETSDQAMAQELFNATKDRKEHQLVVEHITQALRPRLDELSAPELPRVRELPRIFHLATPIHGRGRPASMHPADLTQALHPTPAVAGLPLKTAKRYIDRHEGIERGLYCGALGLWRHQLSSEPSPASSSEPSAESSPEPLDGPDQESHHCELCVPLRGGLISAQVARLFAGAGIVETSNPDQELAETTWKLSPMLRALNVQA